MHSVARVILVLSECLGRIDKAMPVVVSEESGWFVFLDAAEYYAGWSENGLRKMQFMGCLQGGLKPAWIGDPWLFVLETPEFDS